MKKAGKALLICGGAAALVAGSVFGTLAFLSDSEEAVNVFTIGKVSMSLAETDVDGDGDTLRNEYRLVPGMEYTKDPTVTIDAGSEMAYVRMILTVHNHSAVQAIIDNEKNNLTDYADLLGGWDETSWIYEDFTVDEDANTIAFEFRYKETVDGFADDGSEADQELPALFETLKVPGTLDNDELQSLYDGGFKMVVEGHAIQSAGFENNEDGAWIAFDGQTAE